MTAFTAYIDCNNKNLTFDQIFNKLLVADVDGEPAFKVITANDALTGNLIDFRKTNLTNVAVGVKSSGGNVLGWNIINPNASAVYVKFFNKAFGSVVVGTDVPTLTLMIPANGSVYQQPDCVQQEFTTAISIATTTGLADTDNTAPGTAIHINVKYK